MNEFSNEAEVIEEFIASLPKDEKRRFSKKKWRIKETQNLTDEEAIIATYKLLYPGSAASPDLREEDEEQINPLPNRYLLITKIVCSGLGTLACTVALVYLQARASGADLEGLLWAVFCELFGLLFIVYPAKNRTSKGLFVIVGLSCLFLGFAVQKQEISANSLKAENTGEITRQRAEGLKQQTQILESQIKNVQVSLESVSPRFTRRRSELQAEVSGYSEKLSAVQNEYNESLKLLEPATDTIIVRNESYIEGARRILMIIVNLILGHWFATALLQLIQRKG